jgi:uncharacterized protein YdeI (YjbR/CyaY-like superfamily)
VRKSIDEESYKIRFTPRKARSIWSAVNISRVAELEAMGLMHSAGREAFAKRTEDKSSVYSYEQRHSITLEPSYEQKLRANEAAWTFFQAQPAWYQRSATHWVMSAKKEETRLKRLATLIEDSANGRTVAPLTRNTKA